jgi:hypothetical protein
MSTLLKQHLNTHKQQLRTLGLQIIIHHTHQLCHISSVSHTGMLSLRPDTQLTRNSFAALSVNVMAMIELGATP